MDDLRRRDNLTSGGVQDENLSFGAPDGDPRAIQGEVDHLRDRPSEASRAGAPCPRQIDYRPPRRGDVQPVRDVVSTGQHEAERLSRLADNHATGAPI